ncbi:MAG: phosphate regulon transcriptional regulatory protein PhoB [Gammaproteobacteria bacterium]|nr:phosphate regulon transcriptional regulatory protein PhoB [Gammaproteobacteria bacterium]
MASKSILVVEDEPDIRELLRFTLHRAQFHVRSAADSEEAIRILEGPLPSVAIIDWMLPGMSGIELAKRIRSDQVTKELPIIILTARSGEADKLQGFNLGIDDYITKPFSPRELVARVRALLRRSGNLEDGNINLNGILLDTVAHSVSVEGNPLHLRPTEYRLLETMMRHPNRAFQRSQLLDQVWGRNVYIDERTVDVHVLRLRNALKPYDKHKVIKTVRGIGYRLDHQTANA